MTTRPDTGFSLVEMVVIVLILGIIAAFSIPTLRGYTESQRLRGASQNLAGQIRLARQKAISTGVEQHFVFELDALNSDYRIQNPGRIVRWEFPKGIVYDETPADDLDSLLLSPTGRAAPAGSIVLVDSRGNRDTIDIQLSGLVLTR